MERSLNKKLVEKGLFEKHSFRDIKHRSKAMEDLYYRLNVLQNEGMIEVNRGRKGTCITKSGFDYLRQYSDWHTSCV